MAEQSRGFKGRGFLVGLVLILIIRLVTALGGSLDTDSTPEPQDYNSYQEEQPDLSEEEFAYADRNDLKRRDEQQQKQSREEDSSQSDSRGRSKGGGSTKSAYKSYRVSMTGEGSRQEASFDWRYVNHLMQKRDYSLIVELLNRAVNAEQDVLDYLEDASLQELGVDPNLQSVSEIQFQLALWKAAYGRMYRKSRPHFDSLAEGFRDLFQKEGFSNREKLDFLITFVQNIRYERPGGQLDVLPPLVTLSRRYGDCDTKSLLLYVMLEKFGYDCVILWSQHYKHAMLGIYDGGSGEYKSYDGRKYYFVETTYPGWAVGQLPPKWDNTRYWYAIKL